MNDPKISMTLTQAQEAVKLPDDPAAGRRQTSPVDPLYAEPTSPEDIRAKMQALGIEPGLVGAVFERLSVLERALRPFAMKAMMLANAQMALQAQGRIGEPAGGTWVNAVTHTSVTADEQIFFTACDAYGRGRVETALIEAFQKVQAAAKAQEEKDAHVEDHGTTH